MTQAKFSFSDGKKRKKGKGKRRQRDQISLKKGKTSFTFLKVISPGVKLYTQAITETTNMFRKAQLCYLVECKLKRNNKSQNMKKTTG